MRDGEREREGSQAKDFWDGPCCSMCNNRCKCRRVARAIDRAKIAKIATICHVVRRGEWARKRGWDEERPFSERGEGRGKGKERERAKGQLRAVIQESPGGQEETRACEHHSQLYQSWFLIPRQTHTICNRHTERQTDRHADTDRQTGDRIMDWGVCVDAWGEMLGWDGEREREYRCKREREEWTYLDAQVREDRDRQTETEWVWRVKIESSRMDALVVLSSLTHIITHPFDFAGGETLSRAVC